MNISDNVRKSVSKLFPDGKSLTTIDILQQKLDAANQKFEILAKATNDAIWDRDLSTNVMSWNQGLKILFGYDESKASYNYESWLANIHHSDKAEVLSIIQTTIFLKKVNWDAIYRYKCLNGNYKYVYDRGYVVYENQRAVRMLGAMQDIDERMTAMAEIEKLSLVASKTENLVIITDADEKIEWVNEGFVKRTGYAITEVIGKTPAMLQGPETDLRALEQMRKCLDAQEPFTGEILNYTKLNEKVWLKVNINPVFDEDGTLVRWVAVETDMTPHKEYENKITTIALELSDLIENANAIILGIDREGLVTEWNKQAIVATGYSKEDVFGRSLTSFVEGQNWKLKMDKYIQTVLEGTPVNQEEFQLVNSKGQRYTLLLSATPRRNPLGEITGVMAVGQDITELTHYRKSLEEKVRERTQELQVALTKEKELVELKNQFVAIASHEFRTPLSTINFAANYLHDNIDKLSVSEVQAKLKKIEKQVNHMTVLLEDVILAGPNELSRIAVSRSVQEIRPLIDKILEDVQHTTKNSHRILLEYDVESLMIETDEKLLRNIVINLLTNAIKFSPGESSIEFLLREVGGEIVIRVKDSGIGISEEDQKKIFVAFQRGSNTNAISGTGLGLSIVKKAVDVLGGNVVLYSKIHEGTNVTVTIPVK